MNSIIYFAQEILGYDGTWTPRDTNIYYCKFIQEIHPILTSLENGNSECFITSDFNIDLLKLNEKEVFSELFDSLTENSFYPKITLPTTFSNKHGTLIYNLFCKLTDTTINTTSRILIKKFSDHQPYFTFLKSQHRFIKINVQNVDALKKLRMN